MLHICRITYFPVKIVTFHRFWFSFHCNGSSVLKLKIWIIVVCAQIPEKNILVSTEFYFEIYDDLRK